MGLSKSERHSYQSLPTVAGPSSYNLSVNLSVINTFFPFKHWVVKMQIYIYTGKNTGVGSHSVLQGIFPIQGSNPGLLHCRQILYHLSHQGSPYIGVKSKESESCSVQFSSVAQLCPTLCNPMDCGTPGLPIHHQFPEFTQTHVH